MKKWLPNFLHLKTHQTLLDKTTTTTTTTNNNYNNSNGTGISLFILMYGMCTIQRGLLRITKKSN